MCKVHSKEHIPNEEERATGSDLQLNLMKNPFLSEKKKVGAPTTLNPPVDVNIEPISERDNSDTGVCHQADWLWDTLVHQSLGWWYTLGNKGWVHYGNNERSL